MLIWYDLEGYYLDFGMLKIFPYILMVIVPSHYAILANKSFHRNTLLSDSIENL